jgi:ankyrin repeat protein
MFSDSLYSVQSEGVYIGEIMDFDALPDFKQGELPPAAAAAAEDLNLLSSSSSDDEDDLGFDDDVLIFDSDVHNRDNNYYDSLQDYLNRDQKRYNNNNNNVQKEGSGFVSSFFVAKEGMPDPGSFNIFSACKAGDLNRVKHLVEVEDVDINRADLFDSVPLFYACLCGHPHVVKYLLDRGAKVDASTFVGARCYVRLNSLQRCVADFCLFSVWCSR